MSQRKANTGTKNSMKGRKGQKVLVTAVSGMGNMLLFTPALARFCSQRPGANVDMLVEGKSSREIAGRLPEVHEVFELGYSRSLFAVLKCVMCLRTRRYHLNLTAVPSNNVRFHLLAAGVGAKERVSHSYPGTGALKLEPLETMRVPARQGVHDIEQNLSLVGWKPPVYHRRSKLPRPRFPLRAEDRKFARDYFRLHEIKLPAIGIHPGSAAGGGQRAKRWPVESFGRLLELLGDRGVAVLVFCGPDEKDLQRYLQARAGQMGLPRVYFPKGSILRVGALIEACDALVSNDSGLMHIGTAVKTPVVALIGPSNPARTAPCWEDCRVLKVPGSWRLGYPFNDTSSKVKCLPAEYWKDIPPERVLAELETVI